MKTVHCLDQRSHNICDVILQGAPVLESESIQEAVQMQDTVNTMQAAAAEVKAEADMVRR